MMEGIDIRIHIDTINLIGTINGDPTPMAIKLEDSGRDSMSGFENMV